MDAAPRSGRRRRGGGVRSEPNLKALFTSIVDHGEESLLSGAYFDRPYPHLTFEKFFADDVYRRLTTHWPELDRYVDLNGARTRKQFTLYDRTADAGDPERTELWRTVCDALSARPIEAALRERLHRGFEIRARGSDEDWPIPMFPQPVLYADFDGYAIKPHPDTRRKVLTMLIYMPDDDSQRELGTTVYKISPMSVLAWKTYGLVKDKTFPFLPNTGCAFVVISPAHSLLHASWHGRAAISVDNAKPRMTILNAYYAKPPEEGVVTEEYAR
jgi:hypothetical protein